MIPRAENRIREEPQGGVRCSHVRPRPHTRISSPRPLDPCEALTEMSLPGRLNGAQKRAMNPPLVILGVDTECGQVRVHDVKTDPGIMAAELDVFQAV
jgi:hypothetical protein